jgi:hypothetical protein
LAGLRSDLGQELSLLLYEGWAGLEEGSEEVFAEGNFEFVGWTYGRWHGRFEGRR